MITMTSFLRVNKCGGKPHNILKCGEFPTISTSVGEFPTIPSSVGDGSHYECMEKEKGMYGERAKQLPGRGRDIYILYT